LHVRDQVFLNDLEVIELLIEVAGQQQHGVFQLALAASARSRKFPIMTEVPIAIAAISSTPPRMSQRIGLSLTEALTLKEAVPFAVIGLDRCQS
jgi:hypothetical protein